MAVANEVDYARTWDAAFCDSDAFKWVEPHPYVARAVCPKVPGEGHRVLDLGCGFGRHALLFAGAGYDVIAADISAVSLSHVAGRAAESGLVIELVEHDMTRPPFPYESVCFDVVVAIQVIHHQLASGIARTLDEMYRVLRPGGLLLVSLPSGPSDKSCEWDELEPHTAAPRSGPEAGIPHHFCDTREAERLFRLFDVQSVELDEWEHWFVTARR